MNPVSQRDAEDDLALARQQIAIGQAALIAATNLAERRRSLTLLANVSSVPKAAIHIIAAERALNSPPEAPAVLLKRRVRWPRR